ncbi:MAG: hypothetical protein AB1768_13080 [Pseudomonadota bacterium]|jgi:hypothetical protein
MLPALVVSAILCFAGALALTLFGAVAPAGAVHLAFAAGVMPLITGAMMHFVPVLTRGRAPAAALHALPLAALAAGLMAAGALSFPWFAGALHIAAGLALAVMAVLAAWMLCRARAALGAPHPSLHWYVAAVLALMLALLAVFAMNAAPGERLALRVFHLHLNTLGFIGLTAIGTLQVLLPTVAGQPDRNAGARLKRDLVFAAAGVLALAVGAAWAAPLAYVGLVLYLVPVVRLGTVWAVLYRREIGQRHGAAPSLSLALFGLAALLFLGSGHGRGHLNGNDAIFGFVLAFLLPLVTGAVSHLLPLWLKPGPQGEWHARVGARLARLGGLRALAFVAAGVLFAFGWHEAAWLAATALALFIGQMLPVLVRR